LVWLAQAAKPTMSHVADGDTHGGPPGRLQPGSLAQLNVMRAGHGSGVPEQFPKPVL